MVVFRNDPHTIEGQQRNDRKQGVSRPAQVALNWLVVSNWFSIALVLPGPGICVPPKNNKSTFCCIPYL